MLHYTITSTSGGGGGGGGGEGEEEVVALVLGGGEERRSRLKMIYTSISLASTDKLWTEGFCETSVLE